jgi:glycosyltransferase involved in cell wall biosynthesis
VCNGPTSLDECVRCVRHLHGIKGKRKERAAIDDRWPYLRAVLEGCDRIVALSGFQAGVFAANGFNSERMQVISHGIERTGLRPPEPSTGPVRFVYVGNLVAAKGVHVAIAAVRAAPDLDLRLTIHGPVRADDPYVQRLLAAAEGDDRISFAGGFAPDDIGNVIAAADYLLLPSLAYDNGPLAVKQAQHVGLPVLVSDLGSLADMVEDDVDGWKISAGDEGAWRAAIARAVDEHRRGRRFAPRPQPDMDDHYRALEDIYRQLTSETA